MEKEGAQGDERNWDGNKEDKRKEGERKCNKAIASH